MEIIKSRTKNRIKITWEIDRSIDKDYIFRVAESMGWYDDPPKVQVRINQGMETWYMIEPYEENCKCQWVIERPPRESLHAPLGE